jgi:hypothetical protein
MGPILIIIGHIGSNHGVQMIFPENQHMIQALAPDTAEQALHKSVGFGRVEGCLQDLDADTSSDGGKVNTELGIVVANQIFGCGAEGGSLTQLLGQLSVGWRVTPTCTILRDPTSRMKNTNRSRKNTSMTCSRSQDHTAEA